MRALKVRLYKPRTPLSATRERGTARAGRAQWLSALLVLALLLIFSMTTSFSAGTATAAGKPLDPGASAQRGHGQLQATPTPAPGGLPASGATATPPATSTPAPTQPPATSTAVATNSQSSTSGSSNLLAQDTFQRADQAGWGTASDGQVWGGDATDTSAFSISSETGRVATSSSSYNAILGPTATDAQVLFSGSMSSYTSSNIGAVLRWTDSSNWYKAYIDGSKLVVQKNVGGSTTVLGTAPFSAASGTSYSLRFQASGSTLSAKVWPSGSAEPSNWMVNVSDSTFSSGNVGLRMLTQVGITASYSSFGATRLSSTSSPAPTSTALPSPTGVATATPPATSTPAPALPPATATPAVTNTPAPTSGASNLLAQDTFQRADQTYWGTASDGHIWGGDANTNGSFAIVGNAGQVSNAGSSYNAILGPTATDAQVLFSGSMSSYTSSNIGAVLRWTDSSNWYKAYIDGSKLVVQKNVGGSTTVLGTAPFSAASGTSYSLRFQASGSTLSAKVWPSGSAEPSNWMVNVSDSTFSSGNVGLRMLAQLGSTASYTSFVATGIASGTAPIATTVPMPGPTSAPGATPTLGPTSTPAPAPTAGSGNINVNFSSPTTPVNPLALGMDETGYVYPSVLANDTLEQQRVKALNLGYIRMDLMYSTSGNPNSTLVCGGSGCDTRWTGDQWIQQIKAAGAQPVVIVHISGQTAQDAANMVAHFNTGSTTPNYVKYWLIGNEPNMNGFTSSQYSTVFNQYYDAMKAVDPNIKVGGPTIAWYDSTWMTQFLQGSGSRVDFLDFHGYPQSGQTAGAYSTLFQWATSQGNNIANLRSIVQSVVPSRASQIFIEMGEWDLNWGGSAQDNINFHSVWTADVIGNILKNGGVSLFYGTKSNALYSSAKTITDPYGNVVNINPDDTNPAYHGHGMFTGEGLFRHFGTTMVSASTSLPNVDVFASSNSNNIVVVNKDPSASQTATFSMNGVSSGTITVWRKDESVLFPDPPVSLGTINYTNGSFTYTLPPFSVTTFVVN